MAAFPAVLNDLDVGIVVHDPETAAIVDANERIESLYGYPLEDLTEMSVSAFSADDYTQAEAIQRIRATASGNPQQFEWRVQRATGELLWVEVGLTATTLSGDEYVLAQVRDITEYKERERRLRLLNRITRHDLRNKVNVIHSYADDVLRDPDRASIVGDLRSIYDAASDLLDLTDTIHALKRMTENDRSRREPLRLTALVSDVVETYRSDYPAVDWQLTCECDPRVTADDGLRLAFGEVIENTVEHNDSDDLSVTVTVTESERTGHAVVRTTDTGEPIPRTEIEATADGHVESQMIHGRGAGFLVMETILESLGGRLHVSNLPDGGSAVEFAIPQTEPATSDDRAASHC